jgi:hypothetical protein
MKYFAFTLKNGNTVIEPGLNMINATLRYYSNLRIETITELENVGVVTDKDYAEIPEKE